MKRAFLAALPLWLMLVSGSAAQDYGSPQDLTVPYTTQGQRSPASYSAAIAGRPAVCPPRAWCGCWYALRKYGTNVRRLWLARAWAAEGRPASGPAPGVTAVFSRGKRGGHVGEITRVLGNGQVMMISGNDGRAVRERVRSLRGVIALRWV